MADICQNFAVLSRSRNQILLSFPCTRILSDLTPVTSRSRLDDSLLVPLLSSISALCTTLLRDEFREIQTLNSKLVCTALGDYLFIAHTALASSTLLVQSIMKDLMFFLQVSFLMNLHISLCMDQLRSGWKNFLMYKAQRIYSDIFTIGLSTFALYFILSAHTNPEIMTNGIKIVPLIKHTKDKLDWLLTQLENSGECRGSLGLLLLNDSVLHSRLPLIDTRMVYIPVEML